MNTAITGADLIPSDPSTLKSQLNMLQSSLSETEATRQKKEKLIAEKGEVRDHIAAQLGTIRKDRDQLLLHKQAMAAKLDAGKVKSFYNEEKKRVTARQGVLAKDKADAERQKKRLADEVKECEKEAT